MLAKKLEIKNPNKDLPCKFSIVLIDQNEMLLNLLDFELAERKGFSVTHSTNGVELLNSDEPQPDLIIMDLIMEGISGIEFIKELRSTKSFTHTKVIVLSEKLNDADIRQLESLKVDDIIQKPVNISELLFRVEKVRE
ncbi:MAG: response regulator transcription factor [Balneola sp.]|nr:response regulator transcription factor [Balneola sp.]MBO6650985.1 response regulator transcription factor [Balneola sp.]MBO6711146.1 response regulator transcription factor [Balneola sp.]MBO6869081.1 response regulator transcription factor [Balneola sp.]